jgi:hypothetical protein
LEIAMRYRTLSANGDMSFGADSANFLVNTPATVAQAIRTRLKLFTGEWFLDLTAGMPWMQQVIGKGTAGEYDTAIQLCILQTQGVTGISSYSSVANATTRPLTVTVSVDTVYGSTNDLVVLLGAS